MWVFDYDWPLRFAVKKWATIFRTRFCTKWPVSNYTGKSVGGGRKDLMYGLRAKMQFNLGSDSHAFFFHTAFMLGPLAINSLSGNVYFT